MLHKNVLLFKFLTHVKHSSHTVVIKIRVLFASVQFMMAPRRKYKKMPMEVSIVLRYLHQDRHIAGKELVNRSPEYPARTIYLHMKLPIGACAVDKRHKNPGRPRKLKSRDERRLVNEINKLREMSGIFNSNHIQEAAGIAKSNVSNRTVSRCLGKMKYR